MSDDLDEPTWTDWEQAKPAQRADLFPEAFARGTRNVEEHERLLREKSLHQCQCLGCRGSRAAARGVYHSNDPRF